MNVKELKEFLKDIDDDVEVVVFDECSGNAMIDIFDIERNEETDEIVIVI